VVDCVCNSVAELLSNVLRWWRS